MKIRFFYTALVIASCTVMLPSCASRKDPEVRAINSAEAGFTLDNTLQELLADPGAKAVLEKQIPNVINSPQMSMAKNMSLRQIAGFAAAKIDQTKLATIASELAAVKPANPAKTVVTTPVVVKTLAGTLEGVNAEGMITFKGVPLGEAPVGDLRWKYAQPAKTWAGVRKADTFAPPCMQPVSPILNVGNTKPSEDCLYLNVWTKDVAPAVKKPVMVHIYGGGFTLGSTSMEMVDGTALASKDAVVVTLPYRVGTLGYLAHPELTRENPHHASGNYAMSDLVLGLQWIKDNIAQFGGDPDNVTIFGCSAGGHMSSYLLTSPQAKGLFRRVIAESGSQFTHGDETPNMAPLAEAEQTGLVLAKKMGATTLADMRKVPAEKIIAAQATGLDGNTTMALPNADGYFLPVDQYDAFKSNTQNNVDLMTGWCSNEGLMFAARWQLWDTADKLKTYARQFAKGHEAEFLKAYPSATPEQAKMSGVAYAGDELFGYQNFKLAQLQVASGKKTYVYHFERADSNAVARMMAPGFSDKDYAGLHCGQSSYSSGNVYSMGKSPTPEDMALSKVLSSYWLNFARTGNPNGPGLPEWPPYDATPNAKVLIIDNSGVRVDVLPSMSRLMVLDKIYDGRRQSAAKNITKH
ncbi:MAG: carboxylesterase family protein [Spongiibacteraceae bacterium]